MVALIDDVSTTGHQVEAAAKAVERQGCTVACIVLALDRGGAAVLRSSGYRVETVVSVSVPSADASGAAGAADAVGTAGAVDAGEAPEPAG